MDSVAPQRPSMVPGESCWASVSCAGLLDDNELLTGTPTVVEIDTADLTISNVAVSTTQLTINGVIVQVGKAIRFYVSGVVVGVTYKLKVTGTTNSTQAQTRIGLIYIPTTCNIEGVKRLIPYS